MPSRSLIVFAPCAALLALAACTDAKETDSGAACAEPVSNAGDDQTVTLGSSVGLDGSSSSVCERYAEQASYTWAFDTLPTGSTIDDSALSDNQSATATAPLFTPDVVGDYVLTLTIDDGHEQSTADYVMVRVVSGDQPPVADCGGDVSGAVDEGSQLDGTASYDPENAQLEYTWALSDKPSCSALTSADIHNGTGARPTVVPDCDGIYTVSLVVSDGVQYSDPDICYVNVASGNRAPEADAGESVELGGCAENPIQLDGWGSYDLDGDALAYEWSLLSAPSGSVADDASFDDVTSPEAKFTWDVAGTYTFQLQVFDGTEWSAPDLVSVTIDETGNNRRPIANAGDNQEIEVEAECTSSSYTWECEDCEAQYVELDGSSSVDPDGDSLSYAWSESTATVSFSSRYSSITDLVIPAQSATYNADNAMSFDVQLEVADCAASDTDSITITYTCTGVAAE